MSEVTSSMDSCCFVGFKVSASFCITRSISFKNSERGERSQSCASFSSSDFSIVTPFQLFIVD